MNQLLSRRSRQRERLNATGMSVCLLVSLSPKCKKAIFSKTRQFRAMVSIDDYSKPYMGFSAPLQPSQRLQPFSASAPFCRHTWRFINLLIFIIFKEPIIGPLKSKMAASAILNIDMTSCFSAEGGPIWIKFCRLV